MRTIRQRRGAVDGCASAAAGVSEEEKWSIPLRLKMNQRGRSRGLLVLPNLRSKTG